MHLFQFVGSMGDMRLYQSDKWVMYEIMRLFESNG